MKRQQTEAVTVRFPEATIEQLRKLAEQNHRSLSAEVIVLVERALAHDDERRGPAAP